MPNPSGLVRDYQDYPNINVGRLLADVPLTGINTQVDILSFGTVQPGSYLAIGQVTIAQITIAAVVTLKFLEGANVVAGTEATIAIGAGTIFVAVPLSLMAASILKLVGFSTALTSTVKSIALNNGTGTQNLVTSITLLRLS